MTQNEKDLLLKDLCARLPYGVIVNVKGFDYDYNSKLTQIYNGVGCSIQVTTNMPYDIEQVKPYLFPLSSMTKEQYEEWCNLEAEPLDEILTRNSNGEKMSTLEHHLLIAKSLTDSVNYCYKNHFDIYGLIPMGLAIDATGLNIY